MSFPRPVFTCPHRCHVFIEQHRALVSRLSGASVARSGTRQNTGAVSTETQVKLSVTAADVQQVRRWLWDQFNVREGERSAPPAAMRLWAGDRVLAVRSLRTAIREAVDAGECDESHARAWARAASLDGRKTVKRQLADEYQITDRGLRKALARVDAAVAARLNVHPQLPRDQGEHGETAKADAVVWGLLHATAARLAGQADDADGRYSASADMAQVPSARRAPPLGRDRSRRARARQVAWSGLTMGAAGLPVPLDLAGSVEQEPRLLQSSATLSDEPAVALAELRRAWTSGSVDDLPLLLAQVAKSIGHEYAAGTDIRLDALELGTTILRECESLTALAWAEHWLREAKRVKGSTTTTTLNARKTRAHLLQLHGFTDLAARELDGCIQAYAAARLDDEALHGDLVLRRTSVEIARDGEARVDSLRESIRRVLDQEPVAWLRPGLLRNDHQLASMWQGTQRRTFSGRNSRAYERSLERLIEVAQAPSGSPPWRYTTHSSPRPPEWATYRPLRRS